MAITRIEGNQFKVKGRKFTINKLESLSGYRYVKVLEYTFLLKYGITLDMFKDEVNKAVSWARNPYGKDNWANILKWLENMSRSIDVEEFQDATKVMNMLKLCSVFIIEENEDPTEWNESIMTSKVNLWLNNVEIGGFFLLLPNFLKDLNVNWEEVQESLKIDLKSKT